MSLKNTKETIRESAESVVLVSTYYDARWGDTIDKIPCFIDGVVTKAGKTDFTFDFKILDKVSDKDTEFNPVQSDALVNFKEFFSNLYALNLIVYQDIEFEAVEENQLIGWIAKNVRIYDIAAC